MEGEREFRMKVSIFLVTFWRDAQYVPYLLKSISKFCSGFHEVVIAVPFRDSTMFAGMGLTKERIIHYKEKGDGFIHQQGIKCRADEFCCGDYVLHIDSDCLFTSHAKPGDYFVDGKPIVAMTPYASLNGGSPWQACTEKVLGWEPVEMELMRRHPAVYHREDYAGFRKRVEAVHGIPINEYLMPITRHTRKEHSFSEFNALSAYAYYLKRDKYHFINTDTDPLPDNHLAQWWSYGGLDWPMDHAPFEGQSYRQVAEKLL